MEDFYFLVLFVECLKGRVPVAISCVLNRKIFFLERISFGNKLLVYVYLHPPMRADQFAKESRVVKKIVQFLESGNRKL